MDRFMKGGQGNPNRVLFLIFGATGDLARRKLFPALFSLYKDGKLSDNFAVIGIARRSRTTQQFRGDVLNSIKEFARHQADTHDWLEFASHFEYKSMDINDSNGFSDLKEFTDRLDQAFAAEGNRLIYLALAPELFGKVAHNLAKSGILQSSGWHRLVIEKPFGYDLQSAETLNEEICQVFREDEIFRIDHYLGKEMVQNIEVVRFANAFFEPLWNNKYIANIQITLSETVGVEDRAGYYERAGALRDMGQNHMLQMVTMMAMEPPGRLHPEAIRDEKVKVLRCLRKYASTGEVGAHVVRGQYSGGIVNGESVPAYRAEDAVGPLSKTETYFAAKVYVDNFRWAGVPFYMRTGKRLPVKTTEVIVEFKNMPENVYLAQNNKLEPNLIAFRVSPSEGIYFKMNAKSPGSDSSIVPVAMDFCQQYGIDINTPEAYERLLYDAVRGDSTYFTRWDEVRLAWRFVDRIAEAWDKHPGDLRFYSAGSWGPEEGAQLLSRDGFQWWPVNGQEEDAVIWAPQHV